MWFLFSKHQTYCSSSSGVSCDSCLKENFRGRRYKCLICYDYDLCATCYEAGATTTRHTTEHPMQCILTRSDFGMYGSNIDFRSIVSTWLIIVQCLLPFVTFHCLQSTKNLVHIMIFFLEGTSTAMFSLEKLVMWVKYVVFLLLRICSCGV